MALAQTRLAGLGGTDGYLSPPAAAEGLVESGGAPSRRRDRPPVNTWWRRSAGDALATGWKDKRVPSVPAGTTCFPRRLAGAPALSTGTDRPALREDTSHRNNRRPRRRRPK